jgi:hypothetical protein
MRKALIDLMNQEPVLEKHGDYIVAREDKLPGGAKSRFLPYIIDPKADELVYASPFCGGAAVSLSEVAKRSKQQVTIFYAKRKVLVPRQQLVAHNGAVLRFVDSPAYMTVVQARARAYAQEHPNSQLITIGFDDPKGIDPFVEFLKSLRKCMKHTPPEVWCACSSGMLTKCLGLAFPKSKVVGVVTGLRSHHSKQQWSDNVVLVDSGYKDLSMECKLPEPWETCDINYDRKAWQRMLEAKPPKGSLFFNVL